MISGIEQTFQFLAKVWKRETAFSSSTTEKSRHWAYRAIVHMGEQAVPLILEDLEREADHWFEALVEITGENPMRPEDAGYIERIRQSWLAWGRERALDAIWSDLSPEEIAALPTDGAEQHDHYIYGTPKRKQ